MPSLTSLFHLSSPTLLAETGYDNLMIHYQFDTSMQTPSTDPLSVWHTGGPGGSSMYGLYGELGYFQVSSSGLLANDDYSFNKVSNMLYLESPAGSFLTPTDAGMSSGFSYCLVGGERQETCSWNDTTQAAAYTATLTEFYNQFPEYAPNDLYFIGESYAGQYIPNIANYILTSPAVDPALKARLKGIAVGNGCWGGGDEFMCNGPNEDRDLVELYHGKGLVSTKLYKQIQTTCAFSATEVEFDSPSAAPAPSAECEALMKIMDDQVGPFNIYNVYDNCPTDDVAMWMQTSGMGARQLNTFLHTNAHRWNEAKAELDAMGGGYDWTCGQFDAIPVYFAKSEVREALHMPMESLTSGFDYDLSGPASVTLYPSLLQAGLRVLIYNGDADACVPYIGNEIWTTGMEERGYVTEVDSWHTWYISDTDSVATGASTSYKVVGGDVETGEMFQFVTIRLSGHEVPGFNPRAGYAVFEKFVNGDVF